MIGNNLDIGFQISDEELHETSIDAKGPPICHVPFDSPLIGPTSPLGRDQEYGYHELPTFHFTNSSIEENKNDEFFSKTNDITYLNPMRMDILFNFYIQVAFNTLIISHLRPLNSDHALPKSQTNDIIGDEC